MNKSVMKCCICNNERIGEFITINNKKYHLCCIEQLQQENKKLNGAIQTYDILLKTNVEENKQLKDVIEELRKYINSYDVFKEFSFPLMKREEENKKDLLQILDKVKEVE